uniref:G_PROTEIN_RECEP_F1_2 domain-containing protein n=1 Tax=Haemonchus contortus TaxID=6289 RepID=A0A7I4YNH2_HAECO
MIYFYSISFIIVVFCTLGLFGNLNIIWATYRKPQLQKKHGLLLANLAGYHLVCIACQWVNLSYSVNHQLPRQDECFKLILPYIFAISAQAIMYVVIVGDLLAAVLVPLRHHFFQPFQYVVIVSIPVWIYSTVVLVWGALSVEEKHIMFCNPTLALNGSANRFWMSTNLAIIVVVVILHITVWVILKRKAVDYPGACSNRTSEWNVSLRRSVWRDQKRALNSLTVHLALFFWSWCTTILGIELFGDFLSRWLPNVKLVQILQSYMVFFGLLCFSQSYYILMWKSPEHSIAFKEQLQMLLCCFPMTISSKVINTLSDRDRPGNSSCGLFPIKSRRCSELHSVRSDRKHCKLIRTA